MNNHFIGAQRRLPPHEDVVQDDAGEKNPETNTLQQHAAVQMHTVEEPPILSPTNEDYTISVDQVREHFRQRGLTKSKDTIQRWCRIGDLDCRKQGILNRYFTTESSLLSLEKKLLPDLIAGQTGVPEGSVQADAGAVGTERLGTQVNAAASVAEHSDMQADAPANEGARSGTTDSAELNAGAGTRTPPHADAELAELRAKASGLEMQLEQAQGTIKFLQDEIVSARGQRGDVVKIAEQMLGTLEAIAVGGRLEKPYKAQTGTVRFRADEVDGDRV